MSLLRRNLVYKCFALAIAIGLYWIASGQQNPRVTQNFSVEPDVSGMPPNLVQKAPAPLITISVSGALVAVQAFSAVENKASVDLAQAIPGTQSYRIHYNFPPAYESALEVTGPQLVQISLERKVRQSVPVTVLFDNRPPAGRAYADPLASPARVIVEGSASDVSRVQRVVATANNAGNPSAIDADLPVVAQDSRQVTVDGVAILPPHVHVTLSLTRAPGTKTMILSPDLMGAPAAGFHITNYSISPPTLTVAGPQDLLLLRSSLSVPINVDDIRQNVEQTVTVLPPPGLTIVGGHGVQVRLIVEPISDVSVAQTAQPPAPTAPSASVPTISPTGSAAQ